MDLLKQYLTNKRIIVFMVLLTILVSLVIPLVRLFVDKPVFNGDNPYYDLRISKTITEKGIIFQDNLIAGGREYIAEPYHIMLALILYFFGERLLILLPLIMGIISVILFYMLMKQAKFGLEQIFLIMIILLFSPGFIFTFGTLNDFCISITLILFGSYLFLRLDRLLPSLFIFLIASLFNLLNIVIVISLMLFFSEIYADKKRNSNLTMIWVLLFAFLYYIPSYFSNEIISKLNLSNILSFRSFISDLGAQIGLSIYTLILGIIGIIITWDQKQKLKSIYFLILSLFLISFYFNYSIIYLSFIFSIFAGITIFRLVKRRWIMGFLKEFTLLIIIYGLLFSAISYTNRVIVSSPDKDMQDSLEWLGKHSNPDYNVFSHNSKGLWIEYWAKIPAITDSLFDYKDSKQKLEDSNEIFYSRDIEKTKDLLEKYNIKYIFVDKEMKTGQVWNEKEGLWYLFRNNETFNNIYQKNDIEIWEYNLLGK